MIPKPGEPEAYWDGGYTGNPALFPLFRKHLPDDLLVVNINPLERDEIPKAPHEISNRVNEISFNSSLLRELRAISFVQRLLSEGVMEAGRMKDIRVHMIADDELMNASVGGHQRRCQIPRGSSQTQRAAGRAGCRSLPCPRTKIRSWVNASTVGLARRCLDEEKPGQNRAFSYSSSGGCDWGLCSLG